jgi:hypothetical protein
LNRIDRILANKIALLIKLLQFRIPVFLAGFDALQVERHVTSCYITDENLKKKRGPAEPKGEALFPAQSLRLRPRTDAEAE